MSDGDKPTTPRLDSLLASLQIDDSRCFTFACPECGIEVTCYYEGALVHLQPACRPYLALDVEDYLRWCNQVNGANARVPGDV